MDVNIVEERMEKRARWIIYGIVGLVLGALLVDQGLYILSRTHWFNQRVDNALERATRRELQFGHMGASLRGIFVEDVKIAEQGGVSEGIFAQIGRLQIRFSLLHLLRGHLKIRGIVLSDTHVKLVVRADGTTNWQDWVNSSQTEEEKNSPEEAFAWPITAHKLRIENLQLSYINQQTSRTLAAQGLNLEVKNFSFRHDFSLSLWGNFYHKEPKFERVIPVVFQGKVNLNQLDLSGAYVYVQKLKAMYQNSFVKLQGKVFNWVSPQLDIQGSAHNLSSDLFEGMTALPLFDVKEISGRIQAAFDTEKQNFTLTHASLTAPGFDISGKGKMDYKGNPRYEFSGEATGIFGEMGRWFAVLADPYRLVGTTKLTYTLTQDKITAQFDLQDMGAYLPQAGQLSNVTGELSGWESTDFKTGRIETELAGKFEGNPITLSLQEEQTPQKIVAKLKAVAKEFVWHASASDTTENTQKSEKAATSWPLPPIDLEADVDVEKLDIPYFYGTHIAFDTGLQNITPRLDQAHGLLHLRTENGKIQDIYKLTIANALTKVLFMSLNLTGKVFNSLNVLGVLKSLGGGLVSAVSGDKRADQPAEVKTQTVLGPDGEPLEVPVEQTEQKLEGEMAYDKFDTLVNFNDGVATVKEGTFVSTMMSLRLDGTTDFNTGKVNLTVHAAPGRHEVDGMLPLTLKIGGTVENPEGNMQLLGSVASLVRQTVTNNVVSRQVKKGVKGLFGLFKKKEETLEEQTNPEEQPTEQ